MISAVRKQIEEAEKAYEKKRGKKTLKDLEDGLKRLHEQFAKDEADLNRILNDEDEA